MSAASDSSFPPSLQGAPLLVVGAGIMGAGIAQVAAQAGHPVWLHDAREGAAAEAKARLARSLDALVAKGRLSAEALTQTLARITPVSSSRRDRSFPTACCRRSVSAWRAISLPTAFCWPSVVSR